jgi:hypothetical protein
MFVLYPEPRIRIDFHPDPDLYSLLNVYSEKQEAFYRLQKGAQFELNSILASGGVYVFAFRAPSLTPNYTFS